LSKKLTTENFVEKARQIHGDKYLYDKVVYKNGNTPIIITCPVHGDFTQSPRGHLCGRGCPNCYYDRAGNYSRLTSEQFIKQSRIIHGTRYDYNKVLYVSMHKKVIIGCKIHGDFKQTPSSHLHGNGCFECGKEKLANQLILTKEQFLERVCRVHGDKYSYDLANYKGQNIPVSIICPEHGVFYQKPVHHFKGKGCPRCGYSISKGESELFNWTITLGLRVESRNKKILHGKEIDIYFPDNKLAIEYNGLYAHSSAHPTKNLKTKHLYKTEQCDKLGVRLIQFWDFEWSDHEDACKSLILSALQNNNRLEVQCLKQLKGITYTDSDNIVLDRRLSNGVTFNEYSVVKTSVPYEYITDSLKLYSSDFDMFKGFYYIYDCGRLFLRRNI
jgi:hypothetical protein